jgi:bd-type cytochrome oxidase subunit I
MDSALTIDRLQFAFTVTFHYLFPQLTMGLALLIVVLLWRSFFDTLFAGSSARVAPRTIAPHRWRSCCGPQCSC